MLWLALRFTALPEDADARTEVLKHLASWAYGYTPYIKRYADDSLLLEVSRCLTIFGGVEALAGRLAESLDNFSPHYELGLAHTDKGAWLLSFYDYPVRDADDSPAFVERLREVPLNALYEEPKAVASLRQMGLKSLGEVFDLPLVELGRRFGKPFADYIEGIRGEQPAPPPIYQPEAYFARQISFSYPVRSTDQLEAPARQLLQQLVDFLRSRQRQCRRVIWRLASPFGESREVAVDCERAHTNQALLFELTQLHFERLVLGFEIETLELACPQTEAVDLSNRGLFQQGGRHRAEESAAELVARLQARLGKRAVYQLDLQDEHLPEDSQRLELPFAEGGSAAACRGPRPSWLLTRPQPLSERNGRLYWRGQLDLLRGPERIQGHWWNRPAARDYFVARRIDAVHCWIYRDLTDAQWYAHGIFA